MGKSARDFHEQKKEQAKRRVMIKFKPGTSEAGLKIEKKFEQVAQLFNGDKASFSFLYGLELDADKFARGHNYKELVKILESKISNNEKQNKILALRTADKGRFFGLGEGGFGLHSFKTFLNMATEDKKTTEETTPVRKLSSTSTIFGGRHIPRTAMQKTEEGLACSR